MQKIDCKLTMSSLRDAIRRNDKMYASYLFNTLKECLEHGGHAEQGDEPEDKKRAAEEIMLFLYYISQTVYPDDQSFRLGSFVSRNLVDAKYVEVANDLGNWISVILKDLFSKAYKISSAPFKIYGCGNASESVYLRYDFGQPVIDHLYLPFSITEHYLDIHIEFSVFRYADLGEKEALFKFDQRDIYDKIYKSISRIRIGAIRKNKLSHTSMSRLPENGPAYIPSKSGINVVDLGKFIRNMVLQKITDSSDRSEKIIYYLKNLVKSNNKCLAKIKEINDSEIRQDSATTPSISTEPRII